MFGREYSKHPEILLSSFSQMNSGYKRIAKKKSNTFLQEIYLSLFGIPEIGFQIRSIYFSEIVKNKVQHKKFSKILDAGCGIGTYSFWLSKNFPRAKIIGGDVDKEKIEFCRDFSKEKNISNIEFKEFDITKGAKKEKFDFIVNIDVLEHIEDYKKVIQIFNKLLNVKGYLYIHTPQPDQKRIFKIFRKWSHEDHKHEGYAPEELKSALLKSGFKIIVLRETFGYTGKLAWELNHMSFKKGFIVTGIFYPFLYLLALLDLVFKNEDGLGTAILAQKIS